MKNSTILEVLNDAHHQALRLDYNIKACQLERTTHKLNQIRNTVRGLKTLIDQYFEESSCETLDTAVYNVKL